MGNNNELLDDFGKLSEPINSKDAIKQDLIKLRGIQLVFFAIGLILCFFVIYYLLKEYEVFEGDETKLEVAYRNVTRTLMFLVTPIYLTAGVGAVFVSIESLALSTLFPVPKKANGVKYCGYFVISILFLSVIVCSMGAAFLFSSWLVILIFTVLICVCLGVATVEGFLFFSIGLSLLGLAFLVGLAYCLNYVYKLLEIDIRAYYRNLAEK